MPRQRPRAVIHLPPRPPHFVGRAALLHEIESTLCTTDTGWYSITGMPGVGKSALAYEVVHGLASHKTALLHAFPDGIAAFSGIGRRGVGGLLALLHEIITTFSSASTHSIPNCLLASHGNGISASSAVNHTVSETAEANLAGMIHLTRKALAGKRVLLLLDDLDVQFPLRQAREALLAQNQKSNTAYGARNSAYSSPVVLATSCYLPASALVTHQFHLGPLAEDDALQLFAALLNRSLPEEECVCVERICAAIGYLPSAIEAVATAAAMGTPLSLLAEQSTNHPLDRLLDEDGELHSKLAQALRELNPRLQQRFALLALLGIRSFGLECATAIDTTTPDLVGAERAMVPTNGVAGLQEIHMPSALLANVAADLGQLVRRSLVELAPASSSVALPASTFSSPLSNTRYQLHPLLHAHAMDRLEQLAPEIVHSAQCNIQAYALAYIEHYRGDVPSLEREREILLAALAQAWKQEQYSHVVRLMTGLAYLAGRLSTYEESKHMLLLGIHACRRIYDQHHLASFLNCLSGLLWSRGEYAHAQQVWEESVAIASTLGRPVYLWDPLRNLVYIADILGGYNVAQRCTEILLHAQRADDFHGMVVALFIRALYARFSGDRDSAYADLCSCLHLLSTQHSDVSSHKLFFEMEVQTELARIHGDYARARAYTEMTVSIAQAYCDPYTVAVLLLDQAIFAANMGMLSDARPLVLHLVDLAKQIGTPHLREHGMFLLLQLPEAAHTDLPLTSVQPEERSPWMSGQKISPHQAADSAHRVSHGLSVQLSKRERAILQLVASGLSNQEIAGKLVITRGTVKKHVEHIYNKLDAHSRIQAVAQARVAGLLDETSSKNTSLFS